MITSADCFHVLTDWRGDVTDSADVQTENREPRGLFYSYWLTLTWDHPINNILFLLENPTIVFAPLSVTKAVNTLAAVELITVHYVCLEVFGRARKD